MTDDIQLLRRYLDESSQEAFTELLRRHVDFVYTTAFRQTRNAHRAEDIAQTVFADLARKAGELVRRTELVGWLYTSTCYAAAHVIRSEARRQAREQSASLMPAAEPELAARIDWRTLSPIIDAALGGLREVDRTAILLRFFKNHSFAEVGRALRLTEEASRKRVDRALERLRGQLSRRGVTSTSAALALVLGSEIATAAPAGLAAAIVGMPLMAAASVGTGLVGSLVGALGFMSRTKTMVAAVGALALIGGGSALMLLRNAAERNSASAKVESQSNAAEISRLRKQAADLDARVTEASRKPSANAPATGLAVAAQTGSAGLLQAIADAKAAGVTTNVNIFDPHAAAPMSISSELAAFLKLTPEETAALQTAFGDAQDSVGKLQAANASITHPNAYGVSIVAAASSDGDKFRDDFMTTVQGILGTARAAELFAVGEDQIDTRMDYFGAKEATFFVSRNRSPETDAYSANFPYLLMSIPNSSHKGSAVAGGSGMAMMTSISDLSDPKLPAWLKAYDTDFEALQPSPH